ncbi:LANO_0H07272g1_1 [Lachancea nothofagi CBS 11611]|uniref:LANO_0H07272g1_1 n=1 Tax=Lachancea nothofagi CBS 11611 TaxID=1266666 RepID=A0A1G4KLL4_9SACH|nr:LANO_0H07272g1_1 [Lachancea nothofagi CBS 11611]
MGDALETSNEGGDALVVKRRSLSNYLSNIQKRRQELEERAKAQQTKPAEEINSSTNYEENSESKADKASVNEENGESNMLTNNELHQPEASAQQIQKAPKPLYGCPRVAGDISGIEVSLPADANSVARLKSKNEEVNIPSGRELGGKTFDTESHTREKVWNSENKKESSLPVEKTDEEQSAEKNTDVKPPSTNEGGLVKDLPVSSNIVAGAQDIDKTKVSQEDRSNEAEAKTQRSSTVSKPINLNQDNIAIRQRSEDEESELSEVESDAPTEPASPPRPRLGRLVRGDQLRSSPSRRIPRLHTNNSEESELSDLEDLNHLPISSSILHGDSPPNRSAHIALDSSPVNFLKKSDNAPAHMKKYVAVRKPQNAKKNKVHRDAGGRTRLQVSCDKGKYDSARKLIQEGYNVDDQDNAGNCSLHEAALNGHLEIVELLLQNGANVNVQSFEPVKDTPLIDSAANGHLDVVRLLLRYNADPTIVNSKGLTAIESIEEDSDLDDDEQKIVRGIKIELKRAMKKYSGDAGRRVRSSSNNRHSDSDRSSSNVRMEDEFYWTDITSKVGREKLLRASKEGKLPYVGAYFENGGRVDFKSFLEAVRFGHEDITSLFLAFGAPANMTNREGQTPLMIALGRGHTGTVKLLLKAGADPTVRDKQGRTVLSYAKVSELGLVSKHEIGLIKSALQAVTKDDGLSNDELRDDKMDSEDVLREFKGKAVTPEPPRKASIMSPKPAIPRKRSSLADSDDPPDTLAKKGPFPEIGIGTTLAASSKSMSTYAFSASSKRPKLEASLSPGATDVLLESQRSQVATPGSSNTPKPVESASEKEERLKAEEQYRQKRQLTKKRKEQELLQKLAEDEKKRAEERERQNAERLQKLQEEKSREEEKQALQRTHAEIDRRRRIRSLYPLGLRLVNFKVSDDFQRFLPMYFVTLGGQRHVLDLQVCVFLKDVAFLSKFHEGLEVSRIHKAQIWNIYKFIFMYGGRDLESELYTDLEAMPFRNRAELESQEQGRFLALPMHWIPWNAVTFPDNSECQRIAAQEQMVEISLWPEATVSETLDSGLDRKAPSTGMSGFDFRTDSASNLAPSARQKTQEIFPPRLRHRPNILNALKGPLPSW